MALWTVEAMEKFLVKTTYYVEAETAKEAVTMCQNGDAAYEKHEIVEGNEQWIKTLSVECGNFNA
jgi:hypothetical protein